MKKICTLPEQKTASRLSYAPFISLILLCLAAAPFASVFPDAFEWTMTKFNLLPNAPNFVNAPFADYIVFGSNFLAGIIGVAAVVVSGFVMLLPFGKKVQAK